jgi:hypothetical protein
MNCLFKTIQTGAVVLEFHFDAAARNKATELLP